MIVEEREEEKHMLVPHGFYEALIGPYRLQHTLGSGRLSTLHFALHPDPEQQTVVLTTFPASARLSDEGRSKFLSRFTQEVSVLATLQHPHIVTVNDYGEQDGVPYFVLPAIIADTLQERLRRGKRWSPPTALALLRQIADALDYAHMRGVVHGGLKPACILLRAADEQDEVYLTGFGLERLLARHGIEEDDNQSWARVLSITGTFLGQLEYMAPECVQGAEATSCSDIYALGCILFSLLGGVPPVKGTPFEIMAQQIQFPVPSLQSLRPRLIAEVCAALDPVLQKALAPEPAQRFQSTSTFITAITEALAPFQDRDLWYENEDGDPIQTPADTEDSDSAAFHPSQHAVIIDADMAADKMPPFYTPGIVDSEEIGEKTQLLHSSSFPDEEENRPIL